MEPYSEKALHDLTCPKCGERTGPVVRYIPHYLRTDPTEHLLVMCRFCEWGYQMDPKDGPERVKGAA